MGNYSAVEFRAVTVQHSINANGLQFDVDELGEGDDIALLLHGFPESRVAWRRQLPFLASLGWRAVAVDMRGYGGTSRPAGVKAYGLDHLVADVAALFDALGAKRRLLIGHDWGGIIAWAAAARQVTPLDGLVVMNAPHPRLYGRVLARSWDQMRKSWYVLMFQLPALPERALTRNNARAVTDAFIRNVEDPAIFSADTIETFRSNALLPGAATAMVNYYRANNRIVFDRSLDARIETPTLLVWGDRDAFLGPELSMGYEPYVRDMTLARLPGVSHWVQQEAPDRVNAALKAWMTDHGLAHTGRAVS